MIALLAEGGLPALRSLTFTRTLFAFDFDGTLARIVRDPRSAAPSEALRRELQRLAARVPVAVISGRSRADLIERLGFQPTFVVGNHGLEGLHPSGPQLEELRRICDMWKSSLGRAFDGMRGVEIEDKGYSLSLHYRKSRERKRHRSQLLEACAELRPSPRILLGKCVINLVPQGAPHKGMALLELMTATQSTASLYVGDDDNDEDVFALSDDRILSVRVGRKKHSAARFFIPTQSDVLVLLRNINSSLERDNEKQVEATL